MRQKKNLYGLLWEFVKQPSSTLHARLIAAVTMRVHKIGQNSRVVLDGELEKRIEALHKARPLEKCSWRMCRIRKAFRRNFA